jgi:hypothetical protein
MYVWVGCACLSDTTDIEHICVTQISELNLLLEVRDSKDINGIPLLAEQNAS